MKDNGHERPLVLVVDDEQATLDSMVAVLAEAELACCCCATADEAVTAAATNPPDLIVCDLNVHGESGEKMCERIRLHPGLEDVPVMFLSSTQLPDIIRRSPAFGRGAYSLRKPFEPHVLVELIDQTLGVSEHISAS
jgi:CheY-like chemotaxis protein